MLLKKCFCAITIAPKLPHRIRPVWLSVIVQICGWAILALLPIYCLLMTEYIHYADQARFATFLLERTPVVLFDLGLLYLVWLCVLCLFRRGWLSVLIFGGVFGAVSYTNYLKHAMTGDYFYPWDLLQQAGNLGELMNFITVPFPPLYSMLIAFIGIMALAVYFSGASLPVKWFLRIPVLVLTLIGMCISVSTPNKITALLNKSSLYLEDMALQTSNYIANGFVGAFTVNVLSTNITRPESYSEKTVAALTEGLEPLGASEDFSSPDIILILAESFWDPTLLPGTTFSEDPLKNYRALIEEEVCISGRFFTTGFGGGTVRPEFEVLTGLSTDRLPSGCVPWQYVTSETESYVSIYRDLGYETTAIHPYNASFYNRRAAYPLIGIDTLVFEDTIYALGKNNTLNLTIDGGQITDDTFADTIMHYLDTPSDAPRFIYGISMENHQPYPNKYGTHEITVTNPAFDESVQNAVINFTKGVSHADACLGKLAEYVKSRERDTVLIWFGDHLPTLGAGFGAYVQSGMIGTYDEADYERLYSTPFLVFSNFDLKESTMLHEGKDNNISSYTLMTAAAQLIGAPQSTLMRYLERYYETIPYYNVRLHKAVSAEAKALIDGHTVLTYDIVAGERFLYRD